MQDRYVGDVGDFVKFGLLRAIGEGRRLGIVWYYRRSDRGTSYLQQPEKWQCLDPELFNALKDLVDCCTRSVKRLEQTSVLKNAIFASEPLDSTRRDAWFERVRKKIFDCDLVFADPDNGFSPKESAKSEHILVEEARALAEGRTAVIYHHNGQGRGQARTHLNEIQYWMGQLPGCTCAYWWRRVSPRTFFVINPDSDMESRLEQFECRWAPHGKLVRKD